MTKQSVKRRVISFVGVVIGTGVCGIVIGFTGAFIGARLMQDELFGFGSLAGSAAGMMIGYPIGVIAGLILVNRLLHYKGSLVLGALGSALGAGLTVGLAEPLHINLDPNILFITFFLMVPVLATTGYIMRK
jgi:hypothetical protein